jgi:hypothetical protein
LQLYDRSLKALNNAAGSFNQAATMSRSLRNQEDQVNDYTSSIAEQETAYRDQLIELFGRPYEGDVGPGKTFDTTYYGPDLEHWFVVDRPFASTPLAIADTISPATCSVKVTTASANDDFTGNSIADIVKQSNDTKQVKTQEVTAYPNQFVQYSDVYRAGGMGTRPETGELQSALMDSHLAFLDLSNAIGAVTDCNRDFQREAQLMIDTITNHANQVSTRKTKEEVIKRKMAVVAVAETLSESVTMAGEYSDKVTEATARTRPALV